MINFTDRENLLKLIDIETSSLQSTLDIQKSLNKQILVFIKNFIAGMNIELNFDPNNKVFYYMNESTANLNKTNTNISNLKNLLHDLNAIKSIVSNRSTIDLENQILQYNALYTNYINSIFENTISIEKFIHEISLLDLNKFIEENMPHVIELNKEFENDSDKNTVTSNDLSISLLENTLVISEISGKVILPYKIEKLKEILLEQNDKYSSIEDVIEKQYTIPIQDYHFSAVARFREAFKLVSKKEHGSKIKALTLASELFANYNLHPAIITACNNLNELDIYLSCLEYNELDDFHFFDIKYEVSPVLSDKSKIFSSIK